MNSRIREIRKALNLSQKDFAEKIGLKQVAISNLEKIGSKVTEHNIKAICSQFYVNEDWLRTGCGDMFNESEKNFKEFCDIFDELSPKFQDYLIRVTDELLKLQNKIN